MTYSETAVLDQSTGGEGTPFEQSRPSESRQWTIKNVDASIVSKARAAAKKNGMKINAWVAAALEDAADKQLLHSKPEKSPLSLDLEDIISKIEISRSEEREMIRRIENDISLLMKGQHGMLVEILTQKKFSSDI